MIEERQLIFLDGLRRRYRVPACSFGSISGFGRREPFSPIGWSFYRFGAHEGNLRRELRAAMWAAGDSPVEWALYPSQSDPDRRAVLAHVLGTQPVMLIGMCRMSESGPFRPRLHLEQVGTLEMSNLWAELQVEIFEDDRNRTAPWPLDAEGTAQDLTAVIGFDADTPVAIACLTRAENGIHIANFAVHPARRRRGLGAAFLMRILAAGGVCTQHSLIATPDTAPFFARLGFATAWTNGCLFETCGPGAPA